MITLKDLVSIFFPKRCVHCSEIVADKNFLCNICITHLSSTCFENDNFHQLKKKFEGIVNIEHALSLYFYEKNSVIQNLIKALKYENQEKIGYWLGEQAISIIDTSTKFNNIDLVVPIPLHPEKLKLRKYNQVDVFAKTIAKHIQATYLPDALIKTNHVNSQTKQNKEARYQSVQDLYLRNDNYQFNNKHILLVDDILTTGATLESCAKLFNTIENVQISIITMACVW